MHVRCRRLDPHVLMAQLKDLAGPQSHLDHDDPDIPEHRGRRSQVLAFLIEGKRSLPSLFMQELHAPSEERTLLDQFFLHCTTKDLPQTGQVAVDRRWTPLQLETGLFKGPDHLGRDLIQIFPAKDRCQVTDATQVGAVGVGAAFYLDGAKKTLCKIPED